MLLPHVFISRCKMYHDGLFFSESDPHIQLNDVEPINEDQCKEFEDKQDGHYAEVNEMILNRMILHKTIVGQMKFILLIKRLKRDAPFKPAKHAAVISVINSTNHHNQSSINFP